MIIVRCSEVTRVYGRGPGAVLAVYGTSCAVKAGDRIAITGPSGSGKSTLLHLMAGLDRPSSGTVERPGIDPGDQGRQTGVVFQGPTLLPALDVLENVILAAVLTGTDEATATERGLEALDAVGMRSLARQLPHTLSGGQAQRVAVARAVTLRPTLLLADEPTGQLDHETGARVIDALCDAAHRTGAALVITTHDPVVSSRLDTVWEMHDGRLHVPLRGGVR